MPQIAVLDFDGTLYCRDSLIEFTKYVYRKHPLRLRFLPIQIMLLLCHKLSFISTGLFKEKFLCFLNNVDEEELNVWLEAFWISQPVGSFDKILLDKNSELAERGITVVCVSASPRIFIAKQLALMNINTVIATEIEMKNGHYRLCSENCRGQEKIRRLDHFFGNNYDLIEAYSDNSDDINLLLQAQKGYIVTENREIVPVPKRS